MAQSDEHTKHNITRRGLLLKETREGKGLSIETVHEMTKIPLDVLHAIEEGYTVRMVSAYYFKGFIKMYAKFLGIDPALVLDEPVVSAPLKEDSDKPPSIVQDTEHKKFNEYISRQNKKQTIVGLSFLGIFLFLALIGYVAWGRPSSSAKPKQARPIAEKPSEESPRKKLLATQAADRKVVEQTKVVPPKPEKKEVPKPAAAPKAVVAQTPPPPEPVPQTATGKKVTLTIKSKSQGWLQVKVDGNVVFQSTLRAGAVESWQADKTIELAGKNISALEFEVNGKVLGQLSKTDRGARRVLINREGLTVQD